MNKVPVNRDLLIPRRYKTRVSGVAGLGDLIDQYTQAILDASDAYAYLQGAKNAIASTGSQKLINNWQQLILTGQELRNRGAKINTQPSITGFIDNLFGASSNIPIIGTIDRALSSDLAVYTADVQQFLADVTALKLAIQQYNELIHSGVAQSDATAIIDKSQAGFFESIKGALTYTGIGVGAIALIAAAIIFAPEIKAAFYALKSRYKK